MCTVLGRRIPDRIQRGEIRRGLECLADRVGHDCFRVGEDNGMDPSCRYVYGFCCYGTGSSQRTGMISPKNGDAIQLPGIKQKARNPGV